MSLWYPMMRRRTPDARERKRLKEEKQRKMEAGDIYDEKSVHALARELRKTFGYDWEEAGRLAKKVFQKERL